MEVELAVMPVTVTVWPELIVDALPGTLLAHVPPATELNNVDVDPGQAEAVPVIAAGWVFTVIVLVAKQPVAVNL